MLGWSCCYQSFVFLYIHYFSLNLSMNILGVHIDLDRYNFKFEFISEYVKVAHTRKYGHL